MNAKKIIATVVSGLMITSICSCGKDRNSLGQEIMDIGQSFAHENKPEITQDSFLDAIDNYGADRLRGSDLTDYYARNNAMKLYGYYFIAEPGDEWYGYGDSYDSLIEGYMPFAEDGESPLMEYNPTELVLYYDRDSDLERTYDENRDITGYDFENFTGEYTIHIWYITFRNAEDARSCYNAILNTELENYVIGSKYYTDYELSENARSGILDNSEWYYDLDFNGNIPVDFGYDENLNGDVHYISSCYLGDQELMYVKVDIIGDYYEEAQNDIDDIFSLLDADNPLSDPALISVALRPRMDMMSLDTVVIPEGTEYIADGSFCNEDMNQDHRHTISSIVLPSSLVRIGDNAFSDCSDLASIEIPEGVVSIGSGAFKKCRSLTSLVIPESVVSIGDEAFYFCDGLTSISIPDGCVIGDDAFVRCSSLNAINDMNPVEWAESQGIDPVTIGLS